MPKYLGIDYGLKRCGLAVTDSAGLIATAHSGIETSAFEAKICDIVVAEKIDVVVFGIPTRLHGGENELAAVIRQKKNWLKQQLPQLVVDEYDERFTSKLAMGALHEMGASKKQKKEKINTDIVSAVILLRDYLEWKKHQTTRDA